ncbi:MAG: hypothetical protein HYS12_02355 [Planctomycetes bacterium]|nr:hypothetical protein [Planctomycetota bacterium]
MNIYSAMNDLSSPRRHAGVRLAGLLVGLWVCVGVPLRARADPIPKGTHDRKLEVRLTPEAVVVAYRLDVDPGTAVLEDLIPLAQGGEFEKLSKEHEYYEAFTRVFAPRLAGGLEATLDGKRLAFTCAEHRYKVVDPQNHLRFEFVFRAAWKLAPGTEHTLAFREGNFKDRPGQVTLALAAGRGVRRVVPRLPLAPDLSPEERSRRAKTVFRLSEGQPPELEEEPKTEDEDGQTGTTGAEDSSLVGLFFHSRHTFWVMILLSALVGAIHALQPGHGKTLVAAYLVGERGTVAHALVLGLVTTLTHTGIVLLLAALCWINPALASMMGSGLALVSGLLVICLGFWLLLRRLSGKADHFHLPGSGHHHHGDGHYHHHHHDHHDHDHRHDHEHAHPPLPVQGGWWGLIVLGVTGGIVPCWDAVLVLLLAVSMNKVLWALPMLLAFSAGLAGVLVLIGILVVRTKALAGKRWERSRLFRALPLISAALLICVGLVLCYKSLQPSSLPTAKQTSSDTTGK